MEVIFHAFAFFFFFFHAFTQTKMVSSIRNLMSVVPLLLAERVSILIGFIRACSLNPTLGSLEKTLFMIFKRKFFSLQKIHKKWEKKISAILEFI